MGTTTLSNILDTTLKWVSPGTVARMILNEPGFVTIKFDKDKCYLDANNQHFPFKRPRNLEDNNSEVRK